MSSPYQVVAGRSLLMISLVGHSWGGAWIPNATATVLPGCGHTVHEDCPAETIPLIENFLR
ncbi:alpha/beta fold hydrolase [Nocardia brevicatena]|uniref:alpha/beta fold hydrolase n=1 Tax=Nocardia brevicatena TaxID=37327 RepID=UPI001C3F1FFB|nr:alpha/beta hydrolase [Nocardia brevicatena]